MALKTTVDNTEKLGPVTVPQTAVVGDAIDNDVTNVATSNARGVASLQVVNGSSLGFYFKLQDTLAGSLNGYSRFCIYVPSKSTQFVGFSKPVPFDAGVTVIVSTNAGTGSGNALDGTSSYVLIATEAESY